MSEFSVVMSTYRGTAPAHLREAVTSVFRQTLPPDELIVIVDGPVDPAHEDTLQEIAALGPIRVLRSPHNAGQGAARHLGVAEARHRIVGIMDADDICLPARFERQMEILGRGQADIVGAWIEEFDVQPGDARRVRMVPTTHEQIFRFGKWRSPMNNVTIMFTKEAYYRAGGYRPIRAFEDYDMFVRMLAKGVRFYNVPEILVFVRCGMDMFSRRGGTAQIPTELRLLWRMRSLGYTNFLEFLGGVLIRVPARLMPTALRRWIYTCWLRRDVETSPPSVGEVPHDAHQSPVGRGGDRCMSGCTDVGGAEVGMSEQKCDRPVPVTRRH